MRAPPSARPGPPCRARRRWRGEEVFFACRECGGVVVGGARIKSEPLRQSRTRSTKGLIHARQPARAILARSQPPRRRTRDAATKCLFDSPRSPAAALRGEERERAHLDAFARRRV